MKKITVVALMLILVLGSTLITNAETDVKVKVDDKLIVFPDVEPYINEDNRTLVPVRFIAKNLDCEVSWNEEIGQVGITGRGREIKLNIGQSEAFVNDKKIIFDTKSIIKDDRTFVPLRFVSQALGANVDWDGDIRTINITTEKVEALEDKALFDEILKRVPKAERLENYRKDTIVYGDQMYIKDFSITCDDDRYYMTVRNWSDEMWEDFKKVISVFFPADYKIVYEKIKDVSLKGKDLGIHQTNYKNKHDNRIITVSKSDSGTSVKISKSGGKF